MAAQDKGRSKRASTAVNPGAKTGTVLVPDNENFGRIKSEATRLRDEAGDKARNAAEDGKTKAVETLNSVSDAAREAAGKLKGSQAEPIADYVNDAADAVDRFATRIDEKSVDEMVDDTRDFVRRSPVLVIGTAVAAGFLLSRFLRSTSRR